VPADRTYRGYGFGFIPITCGKDFSEPDEAVSGWWEILMEIMMFLWWATSFIHRQDPDKPPIYVYEDDLPECECPLCAMNNKT